ncbi:hypothetical protein [Actinoplanes utahensis]|uniref:Uncharacterized protein n=1 Tax=Actinoplanes utahensis TaxID=1869 RepID=A0A0A6UN93_ACTUT|nr:hypothetical protein [Actinoplanes utahensis]KHD76876.1 hypothetical protein MB27_13725 [Actinoplanes utahensis]
MTPALMTGGRHAIADRRRITGPADHRDHRQGPAHPQQEVPAIGAPVTATARTAPPPLPRYPRRRRSTTPASRATARPVVVGVGAPVTPHPAP